MKMYINICILAKCCPTYLETMTKGGLTHNPLTKKQHALACLMKLAKLTGGNRSSLSLSFKQTVL